MTLLTTTTDVSGLLPSDYGPLIVQPVKSGSIAYAVATDLTTDANRMRLPIIKEDAAAAWVAEGAEITPDDADIDELTITPGKVAGLTALSHELVSDSNPSAAELVGNGLARSIATQVDAAFFGDIASPAPSGLKSLTGTNTIEAPSAWANLDPFAEAIHEAEKVGATLTSFVAHPNDALALAQLKDQTDSNRPLLEIDATQPTRRLIQGVPLYVSKAVTQGTVWGIPRDRAYLVTRTQVEVDIDRSVYFTSHRVAVRAVMRVGFGFPHPAAIQAITLEKPTP